MSNQLVLVSAIVDLARSDRNFQDHYVTSIKKLLQTQEQLIIYADPSYWNVLQEYSAGNNLILKSLSKLDIECQRFFRRIQQITSQPSWYQQSDWMATSVIRSAHYITLTLMKHQLMLDATETLESERYIWIDAGMFSSFGIEKSIWDFDFRRLPKNKFFITSFPYCTTSEVHGFDIQKMQDLAGAVVNYVCRATLFSGSAGDLRKINSLYEELIDTALNLDCIGTEESIYTILSIKYPDLFSRHAMNSGDISEFLNTIS